MDALCEHNAIDTLLSNFILPLQDDQISTVDPESGKVTLRSCAVDVSARAALAAEVRHVNWS